MNTQAANWWLFKRPPICRWCGRKTNIVPSGMIETDKYGFTLSLKEKEVNNMTISPEKIRKVMEKLRTDGFSHEVPDKVLRIVIAEICDTVDKSIITRIINSAVDLELITRAGPKVWKIVD